jgi:hypothetical protein
MALFLDSTGIYGDATKTLPAPLPLGIVLGGSGVIEFGDGTASAPSIRFVTDTNTGIFRKGSDSLGFTSNGVEIGSFASTGGWVLGYSSSTLHANAGHTIYANSVTIRNDNTASNAVIAIRTGTSSTKFPIIQFQRAASSNVWIVGEDSDSGFKIARNVVGEFGSGVFGQISDTGTWTIGSSTGSNAITHSLHGSLFMGDPSAFSTGVYRWLGSSNGGFLLRHNGGQDGLYAVGAGYFNGTNWIARNSNIGISSLYIFGPNSGGTRIFDFVKQTDSSESDYTHAAGAILATTTSIANADANGQWAFGFSRTGVAHVFNGTGGFYRAEETAEAISVLKNSATNGAAQIFIRFYSNGYSSGNGMIVGNGAGASVFASFSDISLKQNIVPLSGSLSKILAMNPVEFDYINGSGHQTGFIAQEIENIFPEDVSEIEGKKILAGWSKKEAILVNAIQELKQELEAAKIRISELENT